VSSSRRIFDYFSLLAAPEYRAQGSVTAARQQLKKEEQVVEEKKSVIDLGREKLNLARANLPSYAWVLLGSNQGLTALGEKLITIDQANVLASGQLKEVISTHGLQALRRRLISFAQIKEINPAFLSELFTENGLIALEEKLIKPEEVTQFSYAHLALLLTPNGLSAMRNRTICVSAVSSLTIADLEKAIGFVRVQKFCNIRDGSVWPPNRGMR
jgi:hypothetical protein